MSLNNQFCVFSVMSERGRNAGPKVHRFLTGFLAVALTLFALAVVAYAIASGSVRLSGTIDVGLISSIVTITALMAILRYFFGKGNVS